MLAWARANSTEGVRDGLVSVDELFEDSDGSSQTWVGPVNSCSGHSLMFEFLRHQCVAFRKVQLRERRTAAVASVEVTRSGQNVVKSLSVPHRPPVGRWLSA